ncbi:hypothetical protein DPMN_057578 [Dreissena polymorpha]|uniref:Uncharacterized protein n=1 Tax=Dreissena polymorpha TaxID=45954 RepID=A0A9D4HF13_DREPO|nr:hypothetical protein DPMN_057578 [Dreissena polymorpha]
MDRNSLTRPNWHTGVKLKVEPLFYLEVPQDAEAEFQCACDVSHIASCLANEFR